MYFNTKIELKTQSRKIHTKMNDFRCICTTRQNSSSAGAPETFNFCMNFYKISLHLTFCVEVRLKIHYEYASFQFFENS